jgi:hypothetical protein
MMRSIAAMVICVACSDAAVATDLSKIDRTIRKEPVYKSKSPKYCLLVFGAEAAARVWLVLDGDILYVDRNGNGDLTEDGDRVRSAKLPPRLEKEKSNVEVFFNLRDLEPLGGKVDRKYPRIAVMRVKDRGYSLGVELGEGRLQVNFDDRLQWSDRAREAPVLHFDGPLTLELVDNARDGYFEVVKKFNKKFHLHAVIGTRGAGKHTFVALQHGQWTLAAMLDDPYAKTKLLVPEDLHPLAEIEFPSKALDGPPVRVKAVLRDRC